MLSELDPGGSVRIQGVLSEWKVLSEWIQGVLSRIQGVLSESRCSVKSAVRRIQGVLSADPGGSVRKVLSEK